jgi:hypothetical protein
MNFKKKIREGNTGSSYYRKSICYNTFTFLQEGPTSTFTLFLTSVKLKFVKQSLPLLELRASLHFHSSLPFWGSHSGIGKEKANRTAGLGLKSVLRVSAHVETDLFVRLNGADKIIDCPAVWKLWEFS